MKKNINIDLILADLVEVLFWEDQQVVLLEDVVFHLPSSAVSGVDNLKLFRETEKNVYVDAELSGEEKILKEEITSLRKHQKELEELEKKCTHKIFYDKAGWEYDLRFCGVCGKLLELI